MSSSVEGGQVVAVVTGAGSGIGKATALRFAEDGMAVSCFDLRNADQTAAEIERAGGRAVAVTGSVANEEDWELLRKVTTEALGPIGVLANVAGYFTPDDSLLTETRETIDRMIQTNLLGAVLGMRMVLPDMIRRGGGKIVNVSSSASYIALPGTALYAATKAGLEALTAQVAAEYGGSDIQINAMSPGAVDTPLLRTQTPERMEVLQAKRRGRQGMASPEAPAEIISFLASSASNYINGAVLRCGN